MPHLLVLNKSNHSQLCRILSITSVLNNSNHSQFCHILCSYIGSQQHKPQPALRMFWPSYWFSTTAKISSAVTPLTTSWLPTKGTTANFAIACYHNGGDINQKPLLRTSGAWYLKKDLSVPLFKNSNHSQLCHRTANTLVPTIAAIANSALLLSLGISEVSDKRSVACSWRD
jgi:hypothetical protein